MGQALALCDSNRNRVISRAMRLRWRLLGIVLALLPFLVTSLVAQGTMLTTDADDRLAVVLCIDGSPVPMLMAADGSVQPLSQGQTGHKSGDPCLWVAHGQPLIDATAGPPAAPTRDEIALRRMIAPGALSRQTDIPIPLARGPPVA